MTIDTTRHVFVRARDEPSPLYEGSGAFARNVPLDECGLGLPGALADALRSWSLRRPSGGFAAREDLRRHTKQGLATAGQLAGHLGPSWTVRYWDEARSAAKWLCWGCDRLHEERDAHGTPPHPLDITVEGEYGFGPLRSDGFGDFFPDDPVAAMSLSDDLVAALYAWARSIETTLNLYLRDREEGTYEDEWQRQFREGAVLAEQLAHELGPARTVTYKGHAHGGLDALTSVTWRGDSQL